MKKYILIIILLFNIFIKKISAETIYGEYYKVDSINDTIPLDEIKLDTYKIYNTYKEEYIDMGYLEENSDYIKDENDFIYEEKITLDYLNGDEYINVNVSDLNSKKIGMKFGNISHNMKIYEIEIYNKDKKINYKISNINEFEKNNLNINNILDNNLETYYQHEISHLYIAFSFEENYLLEDLKIVMHTKKDNYNSSFLIYMDNRPKIVLNTNIDRKHIITFNICDENKGLVEYSYKNKIKLYKYYKLNKIKKDIYIKEGENLILDDYKIINDYYKREKIVIDDNLIIKSVEQNIDDFIIYSSKNTEIVCNIDYEKNGIYKCNFVLNDINIEKDVIVDINKDEDINNEIFAGIEQENEIVDNIKQENTDIVVKEDDTKEQDDNNSSEVILKENSEIEDNDNNVFKEDNLKSEENIEEYIKKDKSLVEQVIKENNIEFRDKEEVINTNKEIIKKINNENKKNSGKSNELSKVNTVSNVKTTKNIFKVIENNKEEIKYKDNKTSKNKDYIENLITIIFIILFVIKIIKRKRNNVESI